MDAVLTVESDEAVRLATELAELTGASVPQAVTEALHARLEQKREVQRRKAEILGGAARIWEHLKEPLPSSDHSWLYDENGLPA